MISFGDEAEMRSDHQAGTTCSPLGRTPTVATTGRRFATNMLSAVAPTGAFHFMLHDGRATAEVVVEFLRRLLHDANAPVFLVLDGHGIPKAKRVQEFVAARGGRLKLFLAAYSPHLNPDERLWGNVKARIAKRTVTEKPDSDRQAHGGAGALARTAATHCRVLSPSPLRLCPPRFGLGVTSLSLRLVSASQFLMFREAS